MTTGLRRRARPVIAAALAATVVALAGAAITDLSPWYYGLRQPAWKPPDWLFGPAWTLIFATAAAAGVSAWRSAPDRGTRQVVVWLFLVNAALNLTWSVLFFRFHRPDWALYEVAALWLSIAVLIAFVVRFSRTAGALLVPYLVWVTFAATLNLAVVRLNAPF